MSTTATGLSASTRTIRVHESAHQELQKRANASGKSIAETLDDVLEENYRAWFFRETAAVTARLQADPVAWADYQQELQLLDAMGGDGLAEFPYEED